jgi:PAS domain S-box-containing protein
MLILDTTKIKQTEIALQNAYQELSRFQKIIEELSDINKQLYKKITTTKKVGSKKQEKQEQFQTIFNCASVGIACVSIDGKWLLVNQKICEILGYTKEELIARTSQDITHPEDLDTELYLLQRLLAQKIDNNSIEKRYLHKNSSYIWVKLTASVVWDSHKNPQYFIFIVEDISKYKQKQTELQQMLEREKELNKLNAQFICMVSHELRNPLHVISFSATSLHRHSKQWSEEKKLKYLQRIQTSVEHVSQLMDDVLILGRLEAGKLSFQPRIVDLEQFCRELIVQLEMNHSIKSRIIFTSHGDCLSADVDEKILQIVLTNLLDNAIKYSPKDNKVNFILSCTNKEVTFQIVDRGIGISATDRERLFEPFYRGTNVGDIPGNGLGLAIVKKLVDMHQGSLSVASKVGEGTTFTVTLPLNSLNCIAQAAVFT